MVETNVEQDYVLEMKGITKAFPGVLALDRVNLKVREGTVHVLCGENGAGKSTLMKVLSGEHQIDGGEIYFQGQVLDNKDAKSSLNAGIAMIHQELSPILEMTIAENIFLDREPTMGNGILGRNFVDYKQLYKTTQEWLNELGLNFDPHQKMKELSVASMQLVEMTKAISRDAKLIIMDEPTSALTDTEVEILFNQIFALREKGVAMIYITHKMDEIFKIADDITVIRDGQYIASDTADNYTEDKLVAQMVGRTIENVFPKEFAEIGDVVLEVKNLTRYGVFENINFKVRKGEILGLSGLVGAGRTEVVRCIFGLDPIDEGEIWLNGEKVNIKNSADAIKNGIAMVSEDRKDEGLVLKRSVLENISLVNLKKFAPGLLINEKYEKEEADRMIKLLRVKVHDRNVLVSTLSGGNQQKVVLAKWLLGKLNVLILDEPTRGIDVGSKSEIHKLMSDATKEGLAVIMISSELPEVLGMSDRIVVMQEGVKRGELNREESTQEKIMMLATGGKVNE